MSKSKRIFLICAAIFFMALIAIGYDISRRTTFPGSKKVKIESNLKSDTTATDSVKANPQQK